MVLDKPAFQCPHRMWDDPDGSPCENHEPHDQHDNKCWAAAYPGDRTSEPEGHANG